jgi:glycosyltransferase involved in cell wall biosynthesis
MTDGIARHHERQHRITLSVVIPVYCNAATLEPLYARLCCAIAPLTDRYDIVFVNDACPKGSLEVLKRIVLRDDKVSVIDLAYNVGQHQAIVIGLAHAVGDIVAVMDADLQDPPEALPHLVAALLASPDIGVVFAGRRGRYESRFRLVTSFAFKMLIHWIGKVPRDAGSFCVMQRQVVKRLLALPSVPPYLLTLLSACNIRMVSVPIIRQARPVGASAYSEWQRLRLALTILWGTVQLKVVRWQGHYPTQLDRMMEIPLQRFGSRFNQSLTNSAPAPSEVIR